MNYEGPNDRSNWKCDLQLSLVAQPMFRNTLPLILRCLHNDQREGREARRALRGLWDVRATTNDSLLATLRQLKN